MRGAIIRVDILDARTANALVAYLLVVDEVVDRDDVDSHWQTSVSRFGLPWCQTARHHVNGLRIGEICGCNVGDLGEEGYFRTLRIVGKGEKHETIPLEAPVAAQIDRAVGGRTSGPLILTRSGTRMNRKAAAAMLDTVCRQQGLPPMTPHALRRTAIILLLQAGKPLREVQLFARHANSRTTERYDRRVRTMSEHLSSVILREVA